jgi:aspartyl-tRNA(Asn)/glutamyl-tRNA(Gln) amidotransferase subunit C
MKLSESQIKNLAELSRLRESDVQKIEGDITQILDYVEQVQAVDTSHVSSMTRVGEGINVSRTDKVTNLAEKKRRAELIGNESGEIRVPGVFEESEDV